MTADPGGDNVGGSQGFGNVAVNRALPNDSRGGWIIDSCPLNEDAASRLDRSGPLNQAPFSVSPSHLFQQSLANGGKIGLFAAYHDDRQLECLMQAVNVHHVESCQSDPL